MGKNVWNRTKRDARELGRTARVGDVFYTIAQVSHEVAPYEDARLYSEHVVAFMHPFSVTPAMISGSQSVESLVLNFGPVYTERPKNIRNVATPAPQVSGPMAGDEDRKLSRADIRRSEEHVRASGAKRHRWF